jgi:glycosyltransferase involved in cell wall biosynthesis
MPLDPRNTVSMLVRIYRNDTVTDFDLTMESLLKQTSVLEEIVVVRDGPVPEILTTTLEQWRVRHPETVVIERLAENRGAGGALRAGVEAARAPFVGVLDTGDVATGNRIETQREFLRENPDIDVVGGYLAEFERTPSNVVGKRRVPTDPSEIRTYAKSRCPMNQTTVLFRKAAVVGVGNYRLMPQMEDYDLWVRMLNDGRKLANIPSVLAKARVDSGMYARRGGLQYLKEEVALQRRFVRYGFVSSLRAMSNIAVRIPVRLLPTTIRKVIYTHVLRS